MSGVRRGRSAGASKRAASAGRASRGFMIVRLGSAGVNVIGCLVADVINLDVRRVAHDELVQGLGRSGFRVLTDDDGKVHLHAGPFDDGRAAVAHLNAHGWHQGPSPHSPRAV